MLNFAYHNLTPSERIEVQTGFHVEGGGFLGMEPSLHFNSLGLTAGLTAGLTGCDAMGCERMGWTGMGWHGVR